MSVDPLHCSPIVGRTTAGRVGALGAAFGRPHMPWQRTAAALVTQDDGGGRPGIVAIAVQRQTGKSKGIIWDLILERCLLMGPSQRVFLTAQSGKYARDLWAEFVQSVCAEGSPLAGMVAARWSQGSEVATFPNGSTFAPFPPKLDALHSKQSDLVIVDECWKHDAAAGAALEQAIFPTQATRPGAQVILASAAGTADSVWWRGWVDKGRAGQLPYLEYGIGDDGDPTDVDAVIAAHPAVGITITPEFIREQFTILPPGEFARAYGNAWTRALSRTIPAGVWEKAQTLDPLPEGVPVLGVAVAQDGSRSAITGHVSGMVEVIESRPGSQWVARRVADLAETWRPPAIGIRRAGPAAAVADDLDRLGVDTETLTGPQEAAAVTRLMTDLENGAVRFRRHPNMDAAAADAQLRNRGDGAVWAPRTSAGPIPEIEAATLGHWWDTHRPAPEMAPLIYTG